MSAGEHFLLMVIALALVLVLARLSDITKALRKQKEELGQIQLMLGLLKKGTRNAPSFDAKDESGDQGRTMRL